MSDWRKELSEEEQEYLALKERDYGLDVLEGILDSPYLVKQAKIY